MSRPRIQLHVRVTDHPQYREIADFTREIDLDGGFGQKIAQDGLGSIRVESRLLPPPPLPASVKPGHQDNECDLCHHHAFAHYEFLHPEWSKTDGGCRACDDGQGCCPGMSLRESTLVPVRIPRA